LGPYGLTYAPREGALQTFRASLQELRQAFLSVLFPAPCRLCGELLDTATRIPLCRSCVTSFRPLAGPCCVRCGRPFVSAVVLDREGAPLCHVCQRGLYDFDFARSYTAYTETVAGAIILLKYQQVTPLAGWFASILRKTFDANSDGCRADVVVPVPAHAQRLRERGYNQAELIARPLARALGLPCRSYLLVRNRPRPDKLRLTVRERWRTVRGAYTTRQGLQVDNLRVLLVDDVLTTGATLDACSRALRKAGAAKVVALTVARAIPWREQAAIEPPRREPNG
jgi:ComF family protein